MLNHYCAITRVDYKEFRQCLEKEQSALRSSGQRLCRNDTILLVISMMLTILLAFMQSLFVYLSNFVQLVINCRHLRRIKKHSMCAELVQVRASLISSLATQYKEINLLNDRQNFEQNQFYNIKTAEDTAYRTTKLQQHNCNHCFQKKPMRTVVAKSKKVYDTPPTAANSPPLVQEKDKKQKQKNAFKHTKPLYTVYKKASDLRLEYFKLINAIIVYRIFIQNSASCLRLRINRLSLNLSNRTKNYTSMLTFQKCSKFNRRCVHRVVFNYKLV